MTETYPEHRPLLCEEYSDAELHIQDNTPRFQRRLRNSIFSGRARTHALGAANIITRWPDHLSSLITYWWIGLGMIAVMVFVIYNSIIAIAVLPPTHIKPITIQNLKYITENVLHENSIALNIYMHVFVSNNEKFNINNFIPNIESIANKYTNFTYNFIVISHDITQDIANDLGDEKNNEIALNSLWTNNQIRIKKKSYKYFTVKFISLTKYLDNSPLKKYWRLIPRQFIGFLTRCISIWDKGGVVFDPLILTSNTPNPIYIEKLRSVLSNMQSNHRIMPTRKTKSKNTSKRNFNNIRDIINNLENEEINNSIFPDSLSEAETIQTMTIASVNDKQNENLLSSGQYIHNVLENATKAITFSPKKTSENNNSNKLTKIINSIDSTQSKSVSDKNLFPNFLDLFFHMTPKNLTLNSQTSNNSTKNLSSEKDDLRTRRKVNDISNKDMLKILSTTIDVSKMKRTNYTKKKSIQNESSKLIIDLKGNLIATKIACHAFIGTIFSNVLHHTDQESLTDFIITELSLFCKGNLSTCNGVEVILL